MQILHLEDVMNLSKSLIAIALISTLSACANHQSDNFSLTVAHINDTHSHIDPLKSHFTLGKNGEKVYNEFGGYARLMTAAQEINAQSIKAHQPFLFLHGGDAFQGSGYFVLNKGKANADLLSKMHLDAMAVGNHEFDLGPAKLAEFISNVNFPVLANNMDITKEKTLTNSHNLQPYQLFAFDGINKHAISSPKQAKAGEQVVAVIGVVLEDMKDIANKTGNIAFLPTAKTTQATIDKLKAEGVNKIIVLSHIGNAKEIELAKQTTGIDLIVGGHSHTLLGDFTDLGHGNNGIYAQIVKSATGIGETCVVQAGQYAQAIGEVTIDFNKNGELTSCKGQNTLLSNDDFYHDAIHQQAVSASEKANIETFITHHPKIAIVPENQSLRSHINKTYQPKLEQAYGQTIATTPKEIMHVRRPGDNGSDNHGSKLAPLLGEGLVYWANEPAVQQVLKHAGIHNKVTIGLLGAGGVRANIDAGDFKPGNATLEIAPFSNFLSVMTVKGKVIRDLLNTTITATLPENSHAGKFPYAGGLKYTFTETQKHKAGHITNLQVNMGTPAAPHWQALNNDQDYTIVVNNYNGTGNDGWKALGDAQAVSTDRVDIVKQENGTYKAYKVNKLSLVTSGANKGTYKVIYQKKAPQCTSKGGKDICNTDAQSLIDYAKHIKVLEPLKDNRVTVNYIK